VRLLRCGVHIRHHQLDLVDRAEVRGAADAWTPSPYWSGPKASSPGSCPPAGTATPPRWCVGSHIVRPAGLSTALTVVSGSLGRKSASRRAVQPVCRSLVMTVDAAPSGKAPHGRSRLGSGYRCAGDDVRCRCLRGARRQQSGLAAVGLHSAHAGGASARPQPLRAGEWVLDLRLAGPQCAPDNGAVAHHAVVYTLPTGGAVAVRGRDAKPPGLGCQCFGLADAAPHKHLRRN